MFAGLAIHFATSNVAKVIILDLIMLTVRTRRYWKKKCENVNCKHKQEPSLKDLGDNMYPSGASLIDLGMRVVFRAIDGSELWRQHQ